MISLRYLLACNRAARGASRLRLHWTESALEDGAFRELVCQQDALILPYDREAYAHRGSGMVQDGILAGVPVVHSKGIGMKHLLRHTGIAASTPEEFADAIVSLAGRTSPTLSDIAAARDVLRQEFARTKDMLTQLSAQGVDGGAQSAKGSVTRMVSSRSGEVERSATGH